jgi:hypothetical protein
VDGVLAPLHLLEGVEPLTEQLDVDLAVGQIGGRDAQVLRTVTDTGAEGF